MSWVRSRSPRPSSPRVPLDFEEALYGKKKRKPAIYYALYSGRRKWLSLCFLAIVLLYILTHSTRHLDPEAAFELELPPVLRTDTSSNNVTSETLPPIVWSRRADKVKAAFVHAYSGYKNHAWKHDELRPVSGSYAQSINGWGVTLFDSLDTILIMDLPNLWRESLEAVKQVTFEQSRFDFAPFFETVIRYLGGLLSAYALSGEEVLLTKADGLGESLLKAISTPSGFPRFSVNTVTGNTKSSHQPYVPLSEILTCQLEYKYLAHLTGKAEYFHKVNDIVKKVHDAGIEGSALPMSWNIETGLPRERSPFSMGSGADSGFEYLLKQYLLSGSFETLPREMYVQSMNSAIERLLYLSPTRQLLYVTELTSNVPGYTLGQLSCFLPGLLLLGVHSLELPPRTAQIHTWAAEGLAQTCWITFADQRTGLAPDLIAMHHKHRSAEKERWLDAVKQWDQAGRPTGIPPGLGLVEPIQQSHDEVKDKDYYINRGSYLLRPETVETCFVLWKLTGKEIWRQRAWSIFEAIDSQAKTEFGYGVVHGVDTTHPEIGDEMPSWFLAETLKYLYLTFTDKDPLPLDKWVFNTEAHAFPRFHWTAAEKNAYFGI